MAVPITWESFFWDKSPSICFIFRVSGFCKLPSVVGIALEVLQVLGRDVCLCAGLVGFKAHFVSASYTPKGLCPHICIYIYIERHPHNINVMMPDIEAYSLRFGYCGQGKLHGYQLRLPIFEDHKDAFV